MRFSELISRMNNLVSEEEVARYYKALRQNPVIWDGFKGLSLDDPRVMALSRQEQPLNAGTLAIISYDPDFQFSSLNESKLNPELLEKAMLGYEEYLISDAPIDAIDQAGRIALALLAKSWDAGKWSDVFQELLNRMKVPESASFDQTWLPVLIVALHLVEDKQDYLRHLLSIDKLEVVLSSAVRLALSLPISDTERTDLLQEQLFILDEETQVKALHLLKQFAGSEISSVVAAHLLEKYREMDLSIGPTREYWRDPVAASKLAFQCQAVADIAQLAGDGDTALQLTEKALAILAALVKKGKVKKADISSTKQSDLQLEDIFAGDELEDPDIQAELVYSHNEEQLPLKNLVHPVKAIQQSSKLVETGNLELAREEIQANLHNLTDRELEKLLVEGPDQIQSWQPENLLQSLLDLGAFDTVQKVSTIHLRKNPTSVKVNLAAAKSAAAMGDHQSASNFWEILTCLRPDSDEYKRKLAESYITINKPESAFEILKKLIQHQETVELDDLLALAELAVQVGNHADALEAAGKILEIDPEHARAFTLIGVAHGKTGNLATAEQNLRSAIMFSAGDSRPWLELAELKWSVGAHADAIVALQEGLSAHPGKIDLQTKLAKLMMQEGLVSESFPLLVDLSNRVTDLEIDLLLIEVMESLGMEGIPEKLEEMVRRYPENTRFLGEYGSRLVWSGETDKGLALLDKLGGELDSNKDWKLAWIEAQYKPNYVALATEDWKDKKGLNQILALLDEYLSADPENLKARLLKAELVFRNGESIFASQLFADMQRENITSQFVNPARLLTGLSIAASACGDLETARSTLDQALLLEPEWHILQAVKARVLHLSGEEDQAAIQVLKAIEQAPASPENLVWAVGFLQEIERQDEAVRLLAEAIQNYPDHLGLCLLAAENSLNGLQVTDAAFDGDHLYTLLQGGVDPNDLVRAAVVLAELGDADRTRWCLEKAAETCSQTAMLNLAGLHRINEDLNAALIILEKIDDQSMLVGLLIDEVRFSAGCTDSLALPLEASPQLHRDLTIADVFLPSEWKEIMQSTKPTFSLGFKIALKTGDFTDLVKNVRAWIDADPTDSEARVIGIELALASSDLEWYAQLMQDEVEGISEDYSRQHALLVNEYRIDRGESIAEPVESFDLFESIKFDEPDKLAIIRQLRKTGRIAEAEKTFEMALGVFMNLDDNALPIRVGILRNLAKSAMAIDRWLEALEIIKTALELAPANDYLNILHYQALAMAVEFENRVESLAVGVHSSGNAREIGAKILHTRDVKLSDACREGWTHWMTRLKLACEANNENIRALAKRTPSSEDAAAMMAGLRANGQTKTAMLVGKKYTQDPAILVEMAICAQENMPKEGLDWLSKSLEIDPFQPIALRLQSVMLIKNEALPEALSALENALELWPNESKWHVEAANLWRRLGNNEKPVEHLRIASAYIPDDIEVRRLLGNAYLAAGNLEDALVHLSAVVEKYPDDYETWIALSELHQARGDLDLAMNAADRAAHVNPAGVKAHLQAGRLNWAKGDIKQAIVHADQAVALDPADPANYVFLARLAREQGDTSRALELLEKAASVNAASLQTVIEHANLLKEINGVIAARDLIAAFSQKFPENPDLLTLLAEAEEQCGEIRSAESAAKKALDMKPDRPAVHMLLGRIVEKNGNLDQAAHYYSQAVSLDATLIDGYLKLSQVYIRQREFQKARRVLEQGIGKIPGNVDLYLSCAALLKDAKDYRGAEQMLRKASQVEPRNVNIHRQLGAILALNMVHQSQEVGSQV